MTREAPGKFVLLETARWRLGIVWFTGAAVMLALVAIQSLADVYENKVEDVWAWLLPNLLPTLSLMLGVFAASAVAQRHAEQRIRVNKAFYRLSLVLCLAHLLCLFVVLLSYRIQFAASDGEPPADPMRVFQVSNLWLGPLQGLVTAALSALFFTKEKDDPDRSEEAAPGDRAT